MGDAGVIGGGIGRNDGAGNLGGDKGACKFVRRNSSITGTDCAVEVVVVTRSGIGRAYVFFSIDEGGLRTATEDALRTGGAGIGGGATDSAAAAAAAALLRVRGAANSPNLFADTDLGRRAVITSTTGADTFATIERAMDRDTERPVRADVIFVVVEESCGRVVSLCSAAAAAAGGP